MTAQLTGPNIGGTFSLLLGPDGRILTDGAPPTEAVIATDFNYLDTIISQYANSPILGALIDNFSIYVNPAADIQRFYDLVWNVDTAIGYGLDVWGRIVGVNRVLTVARNKFFGFAQGSPDSRTFDHGPFYSGTGLTSNYALSDDAYRSLILAKALANICDGSTSSINQVLINLFPGRGNCYVVDNLNMSMTYRFDFPLSAVELAVVAQSGVLPKPSGVAATINTAV